MHFHLERLTPNNNSLWKFAKYFTRKSTNKISTLEGPNGPVHTDTDKANTLANHFEKVHYLTQKFSDTNTEQIVNDTYQKIKNESVNLSNLRKITTVEIYKAIKITRPKKAPGHDEIQNIILKNLPKEALIQLTIIFNSCLSLGYFPSAWKRANILAFEKPGKDKKLPQNYRPISLLPTMGKIFERLILNRVLAHLNKNKILIDEQFGFRAHRSTVQQLLRITYKVSDNFNKNKSTAMLLLDIEKAFDAVWHQGLIYKLENYNFPQYLIKLILDYLENRSFHVTVNDKNSTERNISAGVPQGSILGPILFIIYINDLPKSDKTSIGLFADDTTILSSSWSKNQAVKNIIDHFYILRKYFTKWKIKLNINKTEIIVFTHNIAEKLDQIIIDEKVVEPKDSVKYLGVHLDIKLNFSIHVKMRLYRF